jgi:hypothetical protein
MDVMTYSSPTTAEGWKARGVHVPEATLPIGKEGAIEGIGRIKILKYQGFPLCQYECEVLDGKHAGLITDISYEWAFMHFDGAH